jgi:nucleoside-diphosphate-sugar epimerase
MAKVLVTGGTGYVGRALVNALIERGDDVSIFSRSQPRKDVHWIHGDITMTGAVSQCVGIKNLDTIYHLASLPGDTGNPREMVDVNIRGLVNMLYVARAADVNRFVLASSISAYEWFPATKFRPPQKMPVDEDHPCRPQDMYSSTKLMQEVLTNTYYRQYELPTTILRITAVVGPDGSGGGRMWRDFALQLKEGDRVQLPMLSADELSHFVDVRDVAAMHIAAANHPAAVGETFNCCAAKATRGRDFASIIREFAPHAEVAFDYPWSMSQGGEIEFDMSKMQRLLGFVPRYSLRDAVQNIFESTLENEIATSASRI